MAKASAQYTVRRVIDGEDSYIITLDNDTHVIPTDAFGDNGNYNGAVSTIFIFKGITDDTSNWTITVDTPTGVTGTLSGNVYTVSKVTIDKAQVNFTATKGTLTLRKTLNISLSKNGFDSSIVSVLSDVTSVKKDNLQNIMIPSKIKFTGYLHGKDGIAPTQKGYFVIYEQTRSSLTIDEYTGLLKTSTDVTDMEYVVSDEQYPFVERYASTEPESFLEYPIMMEDSIGIKVEFYQDIDRTVIWDRQTIPIVADGVTTYTWRMYADDKFGNGMNAKPDGKRFMGIAVNKTEKNPSSNIGDYEWSPLYDNVKVGGRNLVVRYNEQNNMSLTGSGTNNSLVTYPTPKPLAGSSTMLEAIPVTAGEQLTFTKNGTDYWRYEWLNENYSFISRATPIEKEFTVIAPAGACFLWVSYPTSEKVKIERGNIATDWTPAPEDVDAEITDLSSSLKTLSDTTIPALEDRILNKTEKEAVQRDLDMVTAEKTDVDNQYTAINGNTNLTGTAKTNLGNAKTAYNTAHINLVTAINNVLAVSDTVEISKTLIDAVTNTLKAYASAIATFRTRVEEANIAIRNYQIEQAKTTVSNEIAGVNTALGKIKDFTDTSFSDGVVQRAEAKAIENQLNTLKSENTDLVNQYTIIYGNPNLTGAAKTDLYNAYNTATTGYSARYNTLISTINSVISDGKVSGTEKTNVGTAFANYGAALKTLTEKLNNAIVSIGEKVSQDKVDGLEIGGKNLFSVNQYVSLRNSEGTTNGNMYSTGSSGALVVDGVDGSGGYDTMKMVDLKANTEYIFTFNIPINDRFSFYNTDGVFVSGVSKNWNSDNTQLTFKMGNVDGYIGGKFYPVEQVYPAEIYLMAGKGNKATDWTPAPEDVAKEIKDVSDTATALKNFTDSTFVDGIVSRAESQAIAEHLNTLNKEKTDLDNQYTVIYGNVNLTGAPKSNLGSAKTAYNTAHTNLVSSINTAVSGNNTTPAQKSDVDTKFTAYTTALKTLTQRINEATVTISENIAVNNANAIANNKTGRNKWIVSRYPQSANSTPVMADIRGKTPLETFVYDDFLDSSIDTTVDYSTYHLNTYLYSNSQKNIVVNIANDEGINVYLNGASVYSKSGVSASTAVTLSLIKGWNNFEILLRTISGADYVKFTQKISTLVDDMSCYLGGGFSASQIKQMSDEIDLRVQQGNVINAINVSKEGIRLNGSKINIDGNTTFSSNVIMKSGVIQSADGGTKLDLNNNSLTFDKPFTIGKSTVGTREDITTAVDDLEVGGRNILSDTEGPFEVIKTNSSGYYDAILRNTINIPDGKEYILSFKAKASAPMVLRSHFYSPNTTTRVESSTGYIGTQPDGNVDTEITTEWNSYWIKWKQSETTAPKRVIIARILDTFNNIALEMKEIKFEKGNKATDWTPSPEDVQKYTDDVAKAKAELAETEAKAYADGKITAEEERAIQDAKDKLAEAKKYVDDVEIGGRNLIVQSNITRGKYLTATGNEYTDKSWFYTDFIPVSNYKNLVTSGYSNLGNAPSVIYYNSSKVFVKGINNANLEKAKNITIDNGISFIRFSGMIGDLPTIKLEKGTKATDWTPAPEDVETAYKAVSKAERELAEVNAKAYADGVVSAEEKRAIQDAKDRLTQAQNHAQGLVDGLEIGGRNLVVRHNEIVDTYLLADGVYPTPNKGLGHSTMADAIPVTVGEKLTFTKSGDLHWRNSWLDEEYEFISRFTPTIREFTETVPAGAHYLWVSYPTDEVVQIERGTKATDWTPAPEDVQGQIDNKANQDDLGSVEDSLNKLYTVVNDLDVQTIKDQLAEYQGILSGVEADSQEAKTKLDRILSEENGALAIINTILDDFNQRWTTLDGFIEINGDQTALSISKGNTNMVIDSDSLTFYSGRTPVATITNQYMKIDRGIFVESMQVGRHLWAPSKDNRDHFVLSYSGDAPS